MEKRYSIREECKDGHPTKSTGRCVLGHPKMLILFECARPLCYFRTKPSYFVSSIEKQKIEDHCKQKMEEHFNSAHENKLPQESKKEDKVETAGEAIEKNNSDSGTKKIGARTCPNCFRLFKTRYSLKRHIEQVHENKRKFECLKCERMFCTKGSLDYHRKLKHSKGVEMKCERCPEVFMDFKFYTLHKANVHTKASIVQCRECYVDIKGKGNLTRHMTEVHNVESRFDIGQVECPVYPYKCDEAECYSAFKRKSDLDRHQNAKHVKKSVLCPKCGKAFTYATNLRRHSKSHQEKETLN